MADVDVQVQYTTTERKTRKVKKTSKRRESKDGEVTVTEVEQTNTTTNNDDGGEYTKAMNKDWHSGHFCCWQCDESLTGQRYVLRDEHPFCIKCYESVFANGCEECNKTIGIDSKDLSYKDKHWHEACFLCAKCRVSLVDKQFGSKLDKIYCGNCYDAQFASRCDGCGEVFRAGKYPCSKYFGVGNKLDLRYKGHKDKNKELKSTNKNKTISTYNHTTPLRCIMVIKICLNQLISAKKDFDKK
ncbi:hypothetical protein HF086_007028 [Spodoptera exigua]|uniref:LIM zinc-binding domain-containing protein n=1 Tax=Spodoptera exigua TaxID=7107 RepID=A0A922SAY0_SPOEX|nr:hypothetical protein HF086_007028 [Spodoptera exigua]